MPERREVQGTEYEVRSAECELWPTVCSETRRIAGRRSVLRTPYCVLCTLYRITSTVHHHFRFHQP